MRESRRSLPAAVPRAEDEFDFDIHAWGSLEMQDERRRRSLEPPAPQPFKPQPRRTTPAAGIVAIDPHAMLVAYAGFGADPTSVWQMPRYALRARRRRSALLRELDIARRHKPQEVGTIEAALRTMDASAVRTGFFLLAAYLVLGAAFFVVAGGLVKAIL